MRRRRRGRNRKRESERETGQREKQKIETDYHAGLLKGKNYKNGNLTSHQGGGSNQPPCQSASTPLNVREQTPKHYHCHCNKLAHSINNNGGSQSQE